MSDLGQEREALKAAWRARCEARGEAGISHLMSKQFEDGYQAALAAREEPQDRKAIIEALRILQDRTIGSPEANERAVDVLVAALAAREDTERPCPHCGKLILVPGRSYEIDPAAVCKCGARENTERRDPALAIVEGLLRVVRGTVSESDAATDIEAAEKFLAREDLGRTEGGLSVEMARYRREGSADLPLRRRPREDTERQPDRLVLLARATLNVLDIERAETDVDEWDESDPRCYLYNAASAITERDANAAYSGVEIAESWIDTCLEQAQP